MINITPIINEFNWFLDKDDEKIDIDVKARHKNNNPIYEPITEPISKFPKLSPIKYIVVGNTNVGTREIKIMKYIARNFPITNSNFEIGFETSISIVSFLNSSENDFIATAGMYSKNIIGDRLKNVPKSA